MSMIHDGTGSGKRAAVTSSNRLKVDAVSEDSFVEAAEEGRAFNINTEAVVYSGTAPFATNCLYVKNNESVDMEVVGWFIGEEAGSRSGGDTSKALLFEMYGNPTGTATGTSVDIVNRRIGAAREFDITAIKEPSGVTPVSGNSPLLYQYHYSGRAFGTVNFTIPPGQSILIRVSSSTDTFTAYTGFTGYVKGD